ncbi:replication/maintenance protein RepL [Morganella morganii]|uniref:replication/maintenance protein RepL n=2 Tax=Morganella morganii TaxID=582 RepID=UPI001FFC70FB|nr:replication/maintenance protein RepL [Morganella morganii]
MLKINRLRVMQKWSRVFKSRELFKRVAGLSPVATELYGHIVENCDWRHGRYVATSEEAAGELGVTTRSIQRANKELESAGLIKFKRGIYAVNPEFNWGGRSWNISKSCYYTMGVKGAQVIDFNHAAEAINSKKLEEIGRSALRGARSRKSQGN